MIVITSFAFFAISETGNASARQQEELSHGPAVEATSPGSAPAPRRSAVRKVLDDASGELTSPFTGVTAGIHSEWATRGADLLLALTLYGFGVGYLARALRIRL